MQWAVEGSPCGLGAGPDVGAARKHEYMNMAPSLVRFAKETATLFANTRISKRRIGKSTEKDV